MPRLALENRQLVIGGLDELSEAGSKGQQESIIEKNHAEIVELHKRIEKAGKEIEGKKILIEIGEGLPFKVAEPAVIGESSVRGINMSTAIKNAILESTEEIMVGDRVPGKFDRATKLTLIAVDKNGEPLLSTRTMWRNNDLGPTDDIMSPLYHNYPLPVGAKGEIVVSMCYSDHHGIPVWKAERMGRIDHYVLVLSDSNLAKQAEKSEKEARESAKKQESAK